jgi:hypothetical protein
MSITTLVVEMEERKARRENVVKGTFCMRARPSMMVSTFYDWSIFNFSEIIPHIIQVD